MNLLSDTKCCLDGQSTPVLTSNKFFHLVASHTKVRDMPSEAAEHKKKCTTTSVHKKHEEDKRQINTPIYKQMPTEARTSDRPQMEITINDLKYHFAIDRSMRKRGLNTPACASMELLYVLHLAY
jgi:hypothetical protein